MVTNLNQPLLSVKSLKYEDIKAMIKFYNQEQERLAEERRKATLETKWRH